MADRLRIALVVDRFDPRAGGLEAWTVQFAAHLLARGHDVHVLAFAEAGHGLRATIHLLPAAGGLGARAARIAQAIEGLGGCVVHDTGTGWSGDVFHPQTGSRLLSLDREAAAHPLARRLAFMVSPRRQRWRLQLARLERRQIVRAHRIVAVSRRDQALLAARYGLDAAAIAVIPNGVDVARFASARLAPLRGPMRAQLGVRDATLFVAAAHNLRLKGVDTALHAMGQLVAEGADVRLAVAGGLPDAGLTALALRLGVAARVTWLGQVEAMEAVFAAADAMVHPTRWDACSLSTIEAGAAALPVVTTAANGAAELIEDGRTGLVMADPEDARGLAAHMRSLLDPGLRERLGTEARIASGGHGIAANLAAVEAVLAACAPQ